MGEKPVLWRCRRGIREMDLLLQGFVERHYHDLDESERQCFDRLLEEPDLDIMDWIMEKRETPASYVKLIEKLRQGNYPVRTGNN